MCFLAKKKQQNKAYRQKAHIQDIDEKCITPADGRC